MARIFATTGAFTLATSSSREAESDDIAGDARRARAQFRLMTRAGRGGSNRARVAAARSLADARRRRAIRASATPRASTGSIRSGRPMKRTALDPFILAVSRSIDPVERGARAPISAADRIASPRGAVSRVRPRGCAGGDADRGFRQGSDLARARRSNAHSAATRARLAGSRRERARVGTRSRRRRWVPLGRASIRATLRSRAALF